MQAILLKGGGLLNGGGRLPAAIFGRMRFNLYSSTGAARKVGEEEPEKSVFISQSSDVHTNLALEDWLYKNFNFEKHRVLLLWRNEPCVVIGRHQNLWAEVDVGGAEESGIKIARRNSGGGTVYHDKGNLNCTFFTPRDAYDRKSNLEIICRALKRQFGIQSEITPREDVSMKGYKISGTASKLGKNAYHHCTLLVDSDLKKLSALLSPNTEGIESRATKSIPASVSNLKSFAPSVSIEKALSSIGYEFLRTDQNGSDGGHELIEKQRGFQMINPTNEWFPGLDTLRTELKNWSWTFGRSPDFTLERSYPIAPGSTVVQSDVNIEFYMKVKKGFIETATLEMSQGGRSDLLDSTTFSDLSAFINALKDRPFHMGILSTFEGLLYKKHQNSVSLSQTRDKYLRQALLNA